MVRVSERELKLLQTAKKEPQRQGYASLEESLRNVKVDDEEEDDGDLGQLVAGFTLGAIAAVGALALIRYLSQRGGQGGVR